MEQLLSHLPPLVQSILADVDIDCESLKLGSIAGIVSLLALYFGYLYLRSRREAPVKFNVPLPPQLRSDWDGKKWEDVQGEEKEILEGQVKGKWNSDRIVSYCPADGRILGSGIPLATAESVNRDIQTAKRAQVEWAQTTFVQRRRLLKTLLKYVLKHQDDIVTACCLDSGKTKVDASLGEILVTAEKLKWTIDHGEKALTAESRPTNFLMMYKKNTVRYEPLGVVSACVSWNYPFHNLISPVISALFAGNSIVVKPSEQTAWSSTFFIDIIRRALTSCGHSPDLVQLVICLPQVADVLTSHPDISQLTFIGSRPVAHKVCESAAKSLIPVTVELGGKDPFVILDDTTTIKNLSSVASILMRGVFQSAGQNCVGAERVIALPGTYDKIIDIVTPRVKELKLGSILLDSKFNFTPDVGAMISPGGFTRLESLIVDAVKQGARLIHGGKQYNHPKYPNGHYFAPTLLVDVTPSMRIAQEELFAPVMIIMRATSVSDAISIANSSQYALGASVFGYNSRDVEACVSGIKAGMVAVNDFGAYYAVQLPFGGVKGSGYGRFAGEEGLRGVSNLKAVCVDRFPGLLNTQIPPRIDYPIYKGEDRKRNGDGAWELCKGVVETGYELTIAGRVRGILRILSNS
ncbi:putative oxidoreductase [Talaromyces proteolyticus]|uniref:aldehyde dehydrogenase (NAD(+)) n=1 Tax=Talaromyces proteolyticus TaxID=1131652 RepID=A0AAD4PUJ9_9EURO|nr:putative oxidoreductase [Talaromyces proteolyticus]KAH8695186.1 putative oxidoreductase [Talaromyces proteolyticus]